MRRQRPGRRVLIALAATAAVVTSAVGVGIVAQNVSGSAGTERQLSDAAGMTGIPGSSSSGTGAPGRQRIFQDAATEFGVPPEVLLAVSYNLTQGESHNGQQSADGGYGPMDLIDLSVGIQNSGEDSGKGQGDSRKGRATAGAQSPQEHTLDTAAVLLHESPQTVQSDPRENIRGGAALLADEARKLGGIPNSVSGWYPVVAQYSGMSSASGQQAFADDVFDTLRQGIAHTTSDGQGLRLAGISGLTANLLNQQGQSPNQSLAGGSNATASQPAPECPSGSGCRFVPAAYDWASSDHNDPNNYGNYDRAHRPQDGNKVRYIVIHDTEEVPGVSGSPYDQAIRAFQKPEGQTSAHYVIRSSDGQITQMVPTQDIAWHTENWSMNSESIGIEHEGVAAQGGTWYTEQMYKSSARLVRYLAAKYDIPLDRQHIIGHDDVLPGQQEKLPGAHTDPGPYWDWNHYMQMLHSPNGDDADASARLGGSPRIGQIVAVHPNYAANQPPVSTCDSSGKCTPLPVHGTNFVPLHTLPDATSPLISDSVLHPNHSPGTTAVDDWSDKAVAGRTYVVAAEHGDWTAIWYDGQQAWFYDPDGSNVAPPPSGASLVATALPDKSSVPLYATAYPEQSEYPSAIPFQPNWAVTPLTWSLPAGQKYTIVGQFPAQNYYARFDGANVPDNHTLVQGDQTYLLLSYNHRYVWAKASEVRTQSGL
jgi:N-acetyl-anhydromuramyl-L-alanine amidase AmpD